MLDTVVTACGIVNVSAYINGKLCGSLLTLTLFIPYTPTLLFPSPYPLRLALSPYSHLPLRNKLSGKTSLSQFVLPLRSIFQAQSSLVIEVLF